MKRSISFPALPGIFTVLLFLWSPNSISAQPELVEGLSERFISIDGVAGTRLGAPQDFRIPADPVFDYIRFTLRGADGGSAQGESGTANGGNGAFVTFDVEIGTGPGQLAPGTVIRCIVGKVGTPFSSTNHAGSGGGGGTGILLKDANGDFEIPLAVAGGGSGATYNIEFIRDGQGGRASESGGDGAGDPPGAGGENGERGESMDKERQGGGGLYSGWVESDGGGHGKNEGGHGGIGRNTEADGGYGCGGGGAGGIDFLSVATGGAGGGYSGGGGGTANRGGGGGSYLHPDYTFNGTKANGGADQTLTFGRITYQFYCSARFAGVTLLQDHFCYGEEIIQLQSNARPYCNENGEVVFKCVETGEENTDGIFGDATPMGGGQTYHYELYYAGELVDTLSYTVSSAVVDDELPSVLCDNPNVTFDLNDDPNPTITKSEILINSSDNCGIASFTITGYGDSRTFSCDDLGSHTVTAMVTDYIGNSRSCTANVQITGGYPETLSTLPEEKALDASGRATLSIADVNFALVLPTVCFTAGEIRNNYSIPAAYQTLGCDDVGTQTITLDKADAGFPDVTLELTVTDPVPVTASVAPLTLTLDSTGVAALSKDSLVFTVSDNCYSEAEIIAMYSIPAAYSILDCSQTGLNFVPLDKSIGSFPDITVQVTVESSEGLTLPAITTGYCADSPLDLTRLEDAITTASGVFTYTQEIERLYVPDYLGGVVNVVDLSINDTLPSIPVGSFPFGVAVSPDKQSVYVTNHGSNTLSVIDVQSNTVTATIPVGAGPWGVAISPDGTRAYVANGNEDSLAIIDVANESVLQKVAVGDTPFGVAVSPDGAKVLVTNYSSDNVSVITAADNSVVTVAVGDQPSGLEFNATGSLAYVSINGSISIINTTTNTVTETVATATDQYYLLVSPNGDVYSCHQAAEAISRMEPDQANQVTVFPLEAGVINLLKGLGINEAGSILYVADAQENKIILFDTQGDTIAGVIHLNDIAEAWGNFYVKASLPVATPTAFSPDSGTVVQVAFDGGSGCTANTTITFDGIQPPAAITSQPTAASVCPGEPVTFSVTAEGETLTYQWKKDGVDIPGANTSSQTLLNISAADAADYTCLVTGACGELTSTAATLTVRVATAITSQPTAASVCPGEPVTFGVTAEGETLTYQWKKDGVDIPGANLAELVLANVQIADAADYTCLVTGACGELTSTAATLTVRDATAITGQPAAASVCPGEPVTFSVTAEGENLTYQWKKDGVDIPGANTSSLTLSNISAADAADYTCLVMGTCGEMTSTAATLTVRVATAITSQPAAASVCAGEPVTFGVTAEGENLTYQWKKDGIDIPGANTSSLTLSNISAADAADYTCLVMGTCGNASSNPATLTVSEALDCVPCVDGLVIDYLISESVILRSSDTLTASGVIDANADATFTAADALLFQSGFTVEAGGTLNAFIATCTFGSALERKSDSQMAAQRDDSVTHQDVDRLRVDIASSPRDRDVMLDLFIPESSAFTLSIIDSSGEILHKQEYPQTEPGWKSIQFQPGNLPIGDYSLLIKTKNYSTQEPLYLDGN